MRVSFRICRGEELLHQTDKHGQIPMLERWYFEPLDYEDDELFSHGYGTLMAAYLEAEYFFGSGDCNV